MFCLLKFAVHVNVVLWISFAVLLYMIFRLTLGTFIKYVSGPTHPFLRVIRNWNV